MRHKIEPAGYRLVNQKRAYRAPLGDVAGGRTLAALPIPLGSLTELLLPPTLPGPAGMPLTPVVPAPAEPAFGVPIALPDAAPPAVAPQSVALVGAIRRVFATHERGHIDIPTGDILNGRIGRIRPSQLDPELKPLFPPPNHPSYPAAHGCISTAAAVVLARLFPGDADKLWPSARRRQMHAFMQVSTTGLTSTWGKRSAAPLRKRF